MFIDQNIVLVNVMKSVVENKDITSANKMSSTKRVHPCE